MTTVVWFVRSWFAAIQRSHMITKMLTLMNLFKLLFVSILCNIHIVLLYYIMSVVNADVGAFVLSFSGLKVNTRPQHFCLREFVLSIKHETVVVMGLVSFIS